MRFLSQFNNILVYVLLGAGFTKLMLSLWVDAAIIFGVVILNALLGFIQEGKAEKALDSIRNMLSAEARTVRGGETRMIPAEQLVPGDVVLLESGDKVPADLRLVEAKNLRTEEAALTGESVPAEKSTDAVSANATVGDRESMAFSGTMVVSGRATGVVVATGSETELGRINQLLAERQRARNAAPASDQEVRLCHHRRHRGGQRAGLRLRQMGEGHGLRGAVPGGRRHRGVGDSGRPAGAHHDHARDRRAAHGPAQRHHPAAACGRDARFGVAHLLRQDGHADADGNDGGVRRHRRVGVSGHRRRLCAGGRGQAGRKARAARTPVLELMGRVSMLCNDAELFQEEGAWKVEGDPTEGALYPFATKLGMDRQAEQAAYPRIDAIPFESEHKFMATLHKAADGKADPARQGRAGSHPRALRPAADRGRTAGAARPRALHARRRTGSPVKASGCSRSRGSRIRACKAGSLGPADLPKNLVLLGLIGLLDPPRKEAIEAVKECHGGGIRVTMITGDHKITAAAIAKMLGIGDGKTAITGAEIEEMDTATLQERVRDVDVFARASPEHKLRLVKAIQANKQIVAMTGDGVNDAPALKKADIGVAMGIKGTEVTKEAAGMVLADDNFASITAAVKEGRTVYNNIEKAMLFMLPTNVAQALVIAVAIFFGFTMPITAPQVLWVNMVTSVALGPGDLLRAARARRDERPPRAVDRPIVTGFGIWRVIFVGLALLAYTLLAFFWMKSQGASDALARTVAVNAITIGQVFYLLNSRYLLDSSLSLKAHLGNKYLPLGIGAVVILQLLFTYAPPLQALFDNEAIPLWVWPWLFAGGLVFFLVVEVEKSHHPFVGVLAERRYRGGSWDVKQER